jgi:hypothetical protein
VYVVDGNIGGVPINPDDGMVGSDQFWPTSAFDL